MDTYENDLLNPKVSFDDLTIKYPIPEYLYKYQAFYDVEGKENKYWRKNIRGAFHLSLGCEFEDTNDCKPTIDKENLKKSIITELKKIGVPEDTLDKQEFDYAIDNAITNKYKTEIAEAWRNNCRIGCFTKSSDNQDMWIKYSNNKTGFCIEYKTKENELFAHSTLPVIYLANPYDTSHGLAMMLYIITVLQPQYKTIEECIEAHQAEYAETLKELTTHLFIKGKANWEFEQEYRTFVLKHRHTKSGLLKLDDILDSNFNTDLSKQINTIYLGENFEYNINSDKIMKEIIDIAKAMRFSVFIKTNISGHMHDKCLYEIC